MEKTEAIMLLAIDDQPDNLITLSAVVRNALPQTRVLTATNGPAGIELAAAEDPDVILLDIVMPGMDGFEVCRRLKADDRIRDIPVVFLTALKTDIASRVKGMEAGAEGFLAKPLETAELTAQIRTMTKVKAANRSRRKENDHLEALVAERTANLRETLASLRESEERFHQLFEKAPLGYQSLDSDGNFIEVNHSWLETLGYRREEVIGKWFGDFLAPEYVQAFRERFPVFKADGKVHSEFYMMHKDGSRKYISFDGRIGHNADGSFKQTHFIFKDDTERKRAEETLKASEELLAETERIGKVGGWSFNIDTMAQIWTDEVYRIHEVEKSPNPSVEQGINYYTKESRPIIEKAVQRAIEHGEEFDLELEIITAKGNTRAVHTIGKADLNNRRIYGFFQDITERKQAEERMAEQLHELQRWHNVMLDREGRVIELKREVNELLTLAGQPPRYPSEAGEDEA